MNIIYSRSYSFIFILTIVIIVLFDYLCNIQNFTFIPITINAPVKQ